MARAGRAGHSRITTRRARSRAGASERTSRRSVRAALRCCCWQPARHRSSSTRARNSACRRSTCRSTRLQDPEAIANWPQTLGRDGARTPMPWQARCTDGLASRSAEPWLPVGRAHRSLAVDAQQARRRFASSHFTRRLHRAAPIDYPALRGGSIEVSTSGATRCWSSSASRRRAAALQFQPVRTRPRRSDRCRARTLVATGGARPAACSTLYSALIEEIAMMLIRLLAASCCRSFRSRAASHARRPPRSRSSPARRRRRGR